ncbi:MAG: putative metallopeptidase [DPANN group archaeon]|nr:putative metallopeptidase [DPANN group archaeon]
MISYNPATDIEQRIFHLVDSLDLKHVDKARLKCFRSTGSSSRAIARCYALGKLWQKALNTQAHYAIEVISEKFDPLSEEEKTRVLIHELLHIPQTFGGGFRQHDFACRKNVDILYRRLRQ